MKHGRSTYVPGNQDWWAAQAPDRCRWGASAEADRHGEISLGLRALCRVWTRGGVCAPVYMTEAFCAFRSDAPRCKCVKLE